MREWTSFILSSLLKPILWSSYGLPWLDTVQIEQFNKKTVRQTNSTFELRSRSIVELIIPTDAILSLLMSLMIVVWSYNVSIYESIYESSYELGI